MGRFSLKLLSLFIFLFVFGCARPPIKSKDDALRKTSTPHLSDDLSLRTLIEGIKHQIRYLKVTARSSPNLTFGKHTFSKLSYATELEKLVKFAEGGAKGGQILKWVSEHFDFYEVYGDEAWGEIFLTSYYEPVIQGSRMKTKLFTEPLYKKPDDLVEIQVSKFDRRFARIRPCAGDCSERNRRPVPRLLVPSILEKKFTMAPSNGKA